MKLDSTKRNALISVFDKTGVEEFARRLTHQGFNIISSGGTAKYLRENKVEVVDVEEITGLPAVLGHRVVTLTPQLHGGLLATEEMRPELDELGWPKIDLLYVTFYPLKNELDKEGSTFDSCIEKTDIGGPTMVRSATKGGEVIVITGKTNPIAVVDWIEKGEQDKEQVMFVLRATAERHVSEYIIQSARNYECWHGIPEGVKNKLQKL